MNAWLNQLKVGQKLAILGVLAALMLLLPTITLLALEYDAVRTSRLAADGTQPAKVIERILRSAALHRGASNQVLSGRSDFEPVRAKAQQDLEAALRDFEASHTDAMARESIGPSFNVVTQVTRRLLADVAGRKISASDSFAAHTEAIRQYLDVLSSIQTEYRLALLPDADSYFLQAATFEQLTLTAELMGQVRGLGAGLLARQKATDAERLNMAGLLDRIRDVQQNARKQFDRSFDANQALRESLSGSVTTTLAQIDTLLQLANDRVLAADSMTSSAADFFTRATAPIEATFDLSEKALSEIETLLDARAAAEVRKVSFIALALIALATAATFIGLYVMRGITGSVNVLGDTVRKFAAGDDEVRSRVETGDELGELSAAFDKMMDERVATQRKTQDENEQLNNSVLGLLTAVAQLSRKDLTVKVPVTEDVTGAVADALNLLTGETAKVLQRVSDISADVTQASLKVKQQSDTAMSAAEEGASQVEATAQSLESASSTMSQIANLAQQCNVAAERAIRNTEEALSTVTTTVGGINSTRDTIRETEKRIKRLGERSQEISVAVNLINSISERTHILALNASMHAASAGEAGRGFAVVADEVQRLAENARQATQQIATLVSNIQIETADTVNTMNSAITQVVEGSKLAEQAGRQMQATQATTAELVASVQNIARQSQEQARASTELIERAAQIKKTTQETSRQMSEQTEQTGALVAYARSLLEAVRVFKLSAS
jgi:twitching motility protein PilJ